MSVGSGARRSPSARSSSACNAVGRMAFRVLPRIRRSASQPIFWPQPAVPAILSETSEIYGAEHLLRSRAINEDVARKLDDKIAWWEKYVGLDGASLDNNPSPGNKRGGLTTILEKSLGAVAEGWPVSADGGLRAMSFARLPSWATCSHGHAPEAALSFRGTGQVAGGADMIAFTTGRGRLLRLLSRKRAMHSAPAVRRSTLRWRTRTWQIDCGTIATGDGDDQRHRGGEIFDLDQSIGRRAGKRTKSERVRLRRQRIRNPWHLGADALTEIGSSRGRRR